MKRLTCVALLLPATIALLAPAASAAPAVSTMDSSAVTAAQPATFGIRTSSATEPDNRGKFMFGATAGALVKDYVAISNVSTQPLNLRVYAADAFNTTEGGFDLLPTGKPSKDVGNWIKLGKESVTIPPNGEEIVPFTVTVPRDAPPGDHAAGIVASLLTEQTNADGSKVAVDTRVGTRMYLRVAGELRPQFSVENLDVVYHDKLNPFGPGRTTIRYTVRNTGNVRLEGAQAVRVDQPWGSSVDAPALKRIPELLPGNEISVSTEVSGVWPVVLPTAVVRLEPAAMAGDVNPPAVATEVSDSFLAIPWSQLGVLALLVLGLFLLRWRRKRRRAEPKPPAEREPVGAPV
jgi:hypothetical protein